MKKILKNIKEHILIASLIFIAFNILINFWLYLLDLRYQLYVIILIIMISIISLFLGIAQVAKRYLISKKVFKLVISINVFLLFFVITPIISVILCLTIGTEKIKIINGKKYISINGISTHYYDLSYYDYVNSLIVGTKLKIYGDFGKKKNTTSFDGMLYYYDNNGKVSKQAKIDFRIDSKGNIKEGKNFYLLNEDDALLESKANDYLLPEEAEVLYEKKFGNIVLRFSLGEYALGQTLIVNVLKSTDGGQSFYLVSDNFLQVSEKAKFVFLNENLGFATRTASVSLNEYDVNSLYVTNDGGKSFQKSNIIYETDSLIVDSIHIDELPIYKDDKLIMKCSIYDYNDTNDGYVTKEIWFKSEDSGLTWIVV